MGVINEGTLHAVDTVGRGVTGIAGIEAVPSVLPGASPVLQTVLQIVVAVATILPTIKGIAKSVFALFGKKVSTQ